MSFVEHQKRIWTFNTSGQFLFCRFTLKLKLLILFRVFLSFSKENLKYECWWQPLKYSVLSFQSKKLWKKFKQNWVCRFRRKSNEFNEKIRISGKRNLLNDFVQTFFKEKPLGRYWNALLMSEVKCQLYKDFFFVILQFLFSKKMIKSYKRNWKLNWTSKSDLMKSVSPHYLLHISSFIAISCEKCLATFYILKSRKCLATFKMLKKLKMFGKTLNLEA